MSNEIATATMIVNKTGLGYSGNQCPTKTQILNISSLIVINNASSYGANECVKIDDIYKGSSPPTPLKQINKIRWQCTEIQNGVYECGFTADVKVTSNISITMSIAYNTSGNIMLLSETFNIPKGLTTVKLTKYTQQAPLPLALGNTIPSPFEDDTYYYLVVWPY